MTAHHLNRRAVLKRVGAASVFGAGILSSTASANASDSTGKGPVRARGTIQWKYEYTPDTLTVEEWYVSPDLEERYGTPRLMFNRTVYDRDEFPDSVDESLQNHGTRVATTQLDRLVGTESEWATYIESERDSDDVGTAEKSDYRGPIWEYDESGGIYSRTAPINVVFETPYATVYEVAGKLTDGDFHGLGSCAQTKYIYDSAFGFISQDIQVGTQDYCGDAQDHVRLWRDRGDFGSYDGQFEIGSLHHDPAGHDFGCCCDSFRFDPPEERMLDYWWYNSTADVSYIDLGNARDWESDCKDPNDDYAAYINWYGP